LLAKALNDNKDTEGFAQLAFNTVCDVTFPGNPDVGTQWACVVTAFDSDKIRNITGDDGATQAASSRWLSAR